MTGVIKIFAWAFVAAAVLGPVSEAHADTTYTGCCGGFLGAGTFGPYGTPGGCVVDLQNKMLARLSQPPYTAVEVSPTCMATPSSGSFGLAARFNRSDTGWSACINTSASCGEHVCSSGNTWSIASNACVPGSWVDPAACPAGATVTGPPAFYFSQLNGGGAVCLANPNGLGASNCKAVRSQGGCTITQVDRDNVITNCGFQWDNVPTTCVTATSPSTGGGVNTCGVGYIPTAPGVCTAGNGTQTGTTSTTAPTPGSPTVGTDPSTTTNSTTNNNNSTNTTSTNSTTTVTNAGGTVTSITNTKTEGPKPPEIPTDYNREPTQQEIRDLLKTPAGASSLADLATTKGALGTAQTNLDTALRATETKTWAGVDGSGLGLVSFFSIAPTCNIPTIAFSGHSISWGPMWCPRITQLRTLMAFVFWILGAYAIFSIVTRK